MRDRSLAWCGRREVAGYSRSLLTTSPLQRRGGCIPSVDCHKYLQESEVFPRQLCKFMDTCVRALMTFCNDSACVCVFCVVIFRGDPVSHSW